MMCFGITGPIGHGKSTLAQAIRTYVRGIGLPCEIVSFAAPVKRIARDIFGWDGLKDSRGRRLLQVIGTDAGRAYNPDIWIDHWKRHVASNYRYGTVIVADDVRFENEAALIRRMGGWVIHIRRLGVEVQGGHSSEEGIEKPGKDIIFHTIEHPEVELHEIMAREAQKLVIRFAAQKGSPIR